VAVIFFLISLLVLVVLVAPNLQIEVVAIPAVQSHCITNSIWNVTNVLEIW